MLILRDEGSDEHQHLEGCQFPSPEKADDGAHSCDLLLDRTRFQHTDPSSIEGDPSDGEGEGLDPVQKDGKSKLRMGVVCVEKPVEIVLIDTLSQLIEFS